MFNDNDTYVAKYMRISIEDEREGESNSITNQRIVIDNHLRQIGLEDEPSLEFIDDGNTGTNFKRRGFQEMMEAIQKKKIKMVIIKDLSRLGRDYIDIGQIVEQLFPILGVRLISINDFYDSDAMDYQIDDLELARKNLVNYFYSRDLSGKIRTSNQLLMQQGKRFFGGRVNYGYYIDPAHKRELLVDPPAASIVKRIYQLYLDRYTMTEIAVILNSEKVPSPGEHKKLRNPKISFGDRDRAGERLFWNNESVSRILKNEEYTGVYFGGKSKAIGVGSGKVIKLPKELWIRVENHHEAIISKEIFEQVQEILDRRLKAQKQVEDSPKVLGGKVICAKCHMALKTASKNEYYYCRTPQFVEASECSHDHILVEKIEKLVLDAINSLIVYCSDKNDFEKLVGGISVRIKDHTAKLTAGQNRESRLRTRILTLYEQWKEGQIKQEHFLKQKSDIEKEIVLVLDEVKSLQKKIDELETEQEQSASLSDTVQKYEKAKALTKDMVDAFIKEVTVFDSKHIEIKWNFSAVPISVSKIGA